MIVIEAWLLSKIADKVFSIASEKGSSIVEEWVRDKLGLEPRKKAFKRALDKASQKFAKKYPQWTADLFDGSFFELEAAPILAQFLVQDGNPDPSEMANLWAKSLNNLHPERRSTLISELEPVAADFLADVSSALKAEQALSDLNKNRTLERMANSLTAIQNKIDAGQATPGNRRDYLHWLIERNLYLDMRGTSLTEPLEQVKLEEVYISLQAEYEKTPSAVDRNLIGPDLAHLEANTRLSAEEIEDRWDSHLDRENPLSSKDSMSEVKELTEVISSYSHVVILGDPGSGKSTLLRYLALRYASALYNGRNEAGSELGIARFPIWIRIADYAEYGISKGQSLSDFLIDYHRMHECPRAGLTDLLKTQLAEGKCLILLDGLDEIVSADDRRKVVERVEDFIRFYDKRPNRFVITSRRAGYRSAPLGGHFVHYIVDDMNEAQIHRFLERWCLAVETAKTPDLSQKARQVAALHEVDSILHAVRDFQGVHRLATNPLLLRLLAQLHRAFAQLPRKRIELYQAATKTLAQTWRPAQGVPASELVNEKYLTRLLSRLAYWLHVNKPTGLATEQEVYEVLGKEWAQIEGLDWDEDSPDIEIEIEVEKFLRSVREHTGIFVERAPKRYGFMHLTFEEYYAAHYLIRRSKDRARLIRKHLHQSRWKEPILLGLGLITPEDAEDMVEAAVLVQGEEARDQGFVLSPYESILGRDYLFALRCLGENIPVRYGLKRRLLQRLVDELLYRTGSGRFHHYYEDLEGMLKYLGESDSASILTSLLIEALQDADAQVRKKIMQSFGRMYLASLQMINTLFENIDDVDREVQRLSRWSLGRLKLIDPPSELISALSGALGHRNKDVRKAASRLLGQYEGYSPDVVAALLRVLQDADSEMRRLAASNLKSSLTNPEVVIALIEALHDSDAGVRRNAAMSLGNLDPPTSKVVSALIETLRDVDPSVRDTAIKSLIQLGQSPSQMITALANALNDTNPEIRVGVAKSLGQLDFTSPSIEEALAVALRDIDLSVRCAAAESLGKLSQISPKVESALIDTLHDSNPHIRIIAANSLSKVGQASSQVVITLLSALHDSHNDTRKTAANSLSELNQTSPEGVVTLIEALHDFDSYVRHVVARCLGQLSLKSQEAANALIEALLKAASIADHNAESPELLDQTFFQDVIALLWSLSDIEWDTSNYMIENLKHSNQSVREVASLLIMALPYADHDIIGSLARYLGKLGQVSPDIIRDSIEFMQTSRNYIHIVVKASLEQLNQPPQDVEEVLKECLRNADPQVRESIVAGIGSSASASPIIVQSLISMLRDIDLSVRKAAIKSLGQLYQKGISDEIEIVLLTELSNQIPEIRKASVESLGKIAQKNISREIMTALSNSLKDDEFGVRYAAAESLRQLGKISSNLIDVQLEALNRKILRLGDDGIALFLGQHGDSDETIIQSLWEKLLDEKYSYRRDCAQSLALLGQRFPNVAEKIGEKLMQAIEDPELSKTDDMGWSGHDLAYEALQLLVADEELKSGRVPLN